MARNFKPITPFSVPMKLLIPLESLSSKGVVKKTYPSPEVSPLIFGSFRTFGGTELTVNDTYTIEDTATIETWFRPDIKANCRLYMCETGRTYEIVGTPENIQMRNQYLVIKVQSIGGQA